MPSQTSKYKIYFNFGANDNNLFIFNYCYIKNEILVYRNYLFHYTSYSQYEIIIYFECIHLIHVITRMKYTGSFSLFPKSIISIFVKRSIQKYMNRDKRFQSKRYGGSTRIILIHKQSIVGGIFFFWSLSSDSSFSYRSSVSIKRKMFYLVLQIGVFS